MGEEERVKDGVSTEGVVRKEDKAKTYRW